MPAEEAVERRYRREYDADRQSRTRRQPRRRALETLRQSPVRNGLIGLAVAGAAAPLAVNRYQQALRTDPEHESYMMHGITATTPTSDAAVAQVWQQLETEEETAQTQRETIIQENLERYAEYNLSRELAEAIYDVAEASDIDPDVAYGLVRAESGFKNSSTSPVGAVGLTQLMPATARWLEPGVTRADLRNPSTNLRIGFKYLRSLLDKYDGDTKLALTAYNRGPGTVDKALRNGRNPDNGYADFVFGKKGHGHKLYARG